MKPAMLILFLALALGACQSDPVAPEADPMTLHWTKGEKWMRQTTTVINGNKTFLLRDGELVACGYDWNFDGTCSAPFRRSKLTQTTIAYAEVSAATNIISFDDPGYVIAETSSTKMSRIPDPYDDDDDATLRGARLYVLVPRNAFVVQLENQTGYWWQPDTSDVDITKGQALYPISPRAGVTYTDDRGFSWRAVSSETVTLGESEIRAMVVEQAANNVQPVDWETFRNECFAIVPYYDYQYSRLQFEDKCEEILIEATGKQWIAGGLLVKEEFVSKYYQVIDFGWLDTWGGLTSYTDTPTEDFFVFVNEVSSSKAMELLEHTRP